MKRQTRKIIALTLSTILLAMLMTVAVFAATVADPASVSTTPAPAGLQHIKGEIIGNEGGWPSDNPNPDHGAFAAWDGDDTTFYDPFNPGDGYTGLKLSEPYILKEIRILPRSDQLPRFEGASIYGMNEYVPYEEFNSTKGTLIWESLEPAEDWDWFIIKEDQFKVKDQAFSYYIYYNEVSHGDVQLVELWGVTEASLAAPTIEIVSATPEPAAVEVAPVVEAAPVAAPAPAAAPATGNASVIFALIAFATTAVVTTKAIQRKR